MELLSLLASYSNDSCILSIEFDEQSGELDDCLFSRGFKLNIHRHSRKFVKDLFKRGDRFSVCWDFGALRSKVKLYLAL